MGWEIQIKSLKCLLTTQSVHQEFSILFCGTDSSYLRNMEQKIVGYHKDDENHWVAELACGHFQHVRHNPPMVSRPWVIFKKGRDKMLGLKLECKKCDEGAPKDQII